MTASQTAIPRKDITVHHHFLYEHLAKERIQRLDDEVAQALLIRQVRRPGRLMRIARSWRRVSKPAHQPSPDERQPTATSQPTTIAHHRPAPHHQPPPAPIRVDDDDAAHRVVASGRTPSSAATSSPIRSAS